MKSTNLENRKLEVYKIKLFNELIKLVWEENTEDINNLPEKILGEDIYEHIDKALVINLLRVIMGLNPVEKYDRSIQEMLSEAMDTDEVKQPVISIIAQACNYCNQNNEKNKACLVRTKHTDCNEKNNCSACGECINKCGLGAISDKIQFIQIRKILKDNSAPVYAIVAPAFVGQFGEHITSGKLRAGLKKLGFKDMVEVALAADILTVKEAYDYCSHIEENKSDCFIASCCCPVWINLIQKEYPQLLKNISQSVSPMIACGRIIKTLNKNARVVFIGPCIAKKKEATLEDIKDAVDFVLTFTELDEIFKALKISLQELEEDDRVESSFCGRIYGKSGGVSKAIEISTKKINENIKFKPAVFQGIKECKEGLQKIINKEIEATFIEGMGCIGGCVGGPKRILNTEKGSENIDKYGNDTDMDTPYENLNIVQFLAMMGVKKIEISNEKEEEKILKIFSRNIQMKDN